MKKINDLSVMADMAGCPNRCRHCWLGCHKNGKMSIDNLRDIAAQFRAWHDENGHAINKLGFFSWWREPDFRDDYRELWQLEQELSSPEQAKRFELLSVWRLARDESYAPWAATLEPTSCQITFFGMQENTDWGTRRRGAFADNLLATQRLLAAGIAPRWQLFITKKCLHELDDFLRLIYKLELHKRCEEIGQTFEVFIGGISPEGNGHALVDLFVDEDDVANIPRELINICREGLDLLGQPEHILMQAMLHDNTAPNLQANMHALAVNADFDVFPNTAEPTPWWCLGNLKRDGADKILRAYRDETTPGMQVNRNTPIAELAQQFGNPTGKTLFHRSDLLSKWLHENFATPKEVLHGSS